MLSPSDPNAERKLRIEALREQLKRTRKDRSSALKDYKACADRASKGTPSDSAIFRFAPKNPTKEPAPEDNGVGELSGLEQVRFRKDQLLAARKQRKRSLFELRQTSFEVVEINNRRPTLFLDLDEVRRRLSGDSEGESLRSCSGSA